MRKQCLVVSGQWLVEGCRTGARLLAGGGVGFLLVVGLAYGAPVGERIGREENRTQRIGDQTQQVARELDNMVRDLQTNQLLTRDENQDFSAAREGMDEIGRREIRAVLEHLVSARQMIERAKQNDQLRLTVGAQEKLIARLTEELVRIQYRSQLRHLLEQMRTIVGDQRQAIHTTQNGAVELAATNSDALRSDVLDRLTQAQDGVWHDWIMVRDQVAVITERYAQVPFAETMKQFRGKAQTLPIEPRLAETRENLRGQRFGLAVAGQRQLADHFAELLKILQAGGLSPAEQRSALENLIEKTEEALRQQQDLRAQTETLGQDLTEPLRNEMARAEDQLSNFVRDLAQEADQVSRAEVPSTDTAAKPEANPKSEIANPKSKIQNPKSDNPWTEAKNQAQPDAPAQTPPLSSPAAKDLGQAADSMSNAAGQLNQARAREASGSQQQAINHLANALAALRNQMDAAARADALDALADALKAESEALNELGGIIKDQQDLMGQTEQTAKGASPGAPSAQPNPSSGEKAQAAPKSEIANPKSENPQSAAALQQAQKGLGDRTQDFTNRMANATPAAPPLAKAVGEMDQAAGQLGQAQTGRALPHQNQALQSLREAERKLAEAMAEALDARQSADWIDQIGDLDKIIGQIEQMAGEAETMPPAPAPDMAQEADGVAQELSAMAAASPMGPSAAAQFKDGSQLMQGASGQLQGGQTVQAAGSMHQAASTLGAIRGEMAAQLASDLAQAQAAAKAKMPAKGTPSQQASAAQAAAAAAKANQPATKPGQTGQGQGMRNAGPTNYDPRQIEKDLESGAWSRLPEREREEVLQALKEKYPSRYERALIRYYRNLSRLEGKQ